jgi:hypothetical protein
MFHQFVQTIEKQQEELLTQDQPIDLGFMINDSILLDLSKA